MRNHTISFHCRIHKNCKIMKSLRHLPEDFQVTLILYFFCCFFFVLFCFQNNTKQHWSQLICFVLFCKVSAMRWMAAGANDSDPNKHKSLFLWWYYDLICYGLFCLFNTLYICCSFEFVNNININIYIILFIYFDCVLGMSLFCFGPNQLSKHLRFGTMVMRAPL